MLSLQNSLSKSLFWQNRDNYVTVTVYLCKVQYLVHGKSSTNSNCSHYYLFLIIDTVRKIILCALFSLNLQLPLLLLNALKAKKSYKVVEMNWESEG